MVYFIINFFFLIFSVALIKNYYFEFVISQIENGYFKISEFEEETLFMNIYYFYCFTMYLSPYCRWGKLALRKLELNIRRKGIERDLTNVNYFIYLVKKQDHSINPNRYFFNSEDYFIKLMFLKPIMDVIYSEKEKKGKKKLF